MSNGSLLSVDGNAIWRVWIGTSQDIDLNSRHVGSNLFRTNRRWWVSIRSTTPGKVCAIKLPRQLQICSRSPLQDILCYACEVPGHTTAIIIASLQRLCRIISRSVLGCYQVWSMGHQLVISLVCICPALSKQKMPQELFHLLRIRPEYKAVAHSTRSAGLIFHTRMHGYWPPSMFFPLKPCVYV